MAHEPLDTNLLGRVRRSPGRYDNDLTEIANTGEYWGHFRKLDEFKVSDGVGKAASARQSLVNKYGAEPAVAGFTFKTVRSVDGSLDFLAVMFEEDKIVEGAWEAFHEERAMKAAEVAEKAREKKAAAKVAAEGFLKGPIDMSAIQIAEPDFGPYTAEEAAEIAGYAEEYGGESELVTEPVKASRSRK
jgi:hypothetical protein